MNQYIVVLVAAAQTGSPANQYLVVDTQFTGGPASFCLCSSKATADTIAAALNA